MRTPEDVRAFLRAHNLPGEVLEFAQSTRTVEEAARVVGTTPECILKTLVFVVRGEPHLVLAAGTTRVDYRALAQALGISRKRLRLARPDEVLAWTEYPVGAVPPIALPRTFPVWMDAALLSLDEVYAGGGAENALLRIPVRVLVDVTNPRILPLQKKETHA